MARSEPNDRPEGHKRKIKAKDLATDVKAGMDYPELMSKHKLSQGTVSKLLNNLVGAGLLQQAELPNKPVDGISPGCPRCKIMHGDGDGLCHGCRVILDVFKNRLLPQLITVEDLAEDIRSGKSFQDFLAKYPFLSGRLSKLLNALKQAGLIERLPEYSSAPQQADLQAVQRIRQSLTGQRPEYSEMAEVTLDNSAKWGPQEPSETRTTECPRCKTRQRGTEGPCIGCRIISDVFAGDDYEPTVRVRDLTESMREGKSFGEIKLRYFLSEEKLVRLLIDLRKEGLIELGDDFLNQAPTGLRSALAREGLVKPRQHRPASSQRTPPSLPLAGATGPLSPPEGAQEEFSFCPKCGRPREEAGNFCAKCGSRFPIAQSVTDEPSNTGRRSSLPPNRKSTKDSGKPKLWGAAWSIGCALGMACYFFLLPYETVRQVNAQGGVVGSFMFGLVFTAIVAVPLSVIAHGLLRGIYEAREAMNQKK